MGCAHSRHRRARLADFHSGCGRRTRLRQPSIGEAMKRYAIRPIARTRPTVACGVCGELFRAKSRGGIHSRYCSVICASQAQSRRQEGPGSHLWKDGRTSENTRLRNSAEAEQWRMLVFERDEYTCQFCGQRGGKLTADHIRPWSLYPELRFSPENGRTLCKSCHQQTETFGFRAVRDEMSIRRWAARSDANHQQITMALRKAGASVWTIRLPCDLLCLKWGIYWLIEIKTENGRETIWQKRTREDAAHSGAPYFVVRSPEEAIATIQKATHRN